MACRRQVDAAIQQGREPVGGHAKYAVYDIEYMVCNTPTVGHVQIFVVSRHVKIN